MPKIAPKPKLALPTNAAYVAHSQAHNQAHNQMLTAKLSGYPAAVLEITSLFFLFAYFWRFSRLFVLAITIFAKIGWFSF